jgi:hypothetical protein
MKKLPTRFRNKYQNKGFIGLATVFELASFVS